MQQFLEATFGGNFNVCFDLMAVGLISGLFVEDGAGFLLGSIYVIKKIERRESKMLSGQLAFGNFENIVIIKCVNNLLVNY